MGSKNSKSSVVGSQSSVIHKPVLLQESIEGLDLRDKEIFLDGTYGAGGHSLEALRRYPHIRIIALDQDPDVVERGSGEEKRISLHQANFRDLDQVLKKEGVSSVDAILLDLGFSSDQLEAPNRGFSFLRDEPLDMRLSQEGFTGAQILNSYDENAIELILRGFGEEKYSRRIAEAIVRRRAVKPFETTFDLVEAVLEAVPASYKRGRINPATRTFQALRIAVNDELTSLEVALEKALEALSPKGRLGVISFHSLEDRIVKNFFREEAKKDKARIINKKPIIPTEDEMASNPRSRSAKLRIIEKNE